MSVVVKVVLYAIESSLLKLPSSPMRSRFEIISRENTAREKRCTDDDDDEEKETIETTTTTLLFLKREEEIIKEKKKKRTAMDSPSSSPCPRTLLAWNSIDGSCNVFLHIAHRSNDVDHDQTATAFHFFTSIFLFGC